MARRQATILAGIPARNMTLYHQIRFLVVDPAVWIELADGDRRESTLILRDIEMDRARTAARADHIACPADFPPPEGLSGDRETATAQAAAQFLLRRECQQVVADRSLPLIYAQALREAGIDVRCDLELGVVTRRSKDAEEIEQLREAQRVTEQAMERACALVANATAARDGTLYVDGAPLTSERVRAATDVWLLERGYLNPTSIIAGGSQGADCHELGSGPLFTGQPVIVDIFPQNRETLYNGDCTRTVVHGEIPETVLRMHRAVSDAKRAAIAAIRAGTSGESVHEATLAVIREWGYSVGLPAEDAPESYCAMVHGTGHGIGLEVHEPPLLDRGGPPLVIGDALTVEPGLYGKSVGGLRLEDMVIVTQDGCENLNRLPETLTWR
jgi:Xaa-Pro aminopeptidase